MRLVSICNQASELADAQKVGRSLECADIPSGYGKVRATSIGKEIL
jgi:hypothetical protein